MVALYDTASGVRRELLLRRPGELAMYVCGPTVYDAAHLGHGRHMLVWDVARRFFASRGLAVTYVSNITDIDDKIIERAALLGIPPSELARMEEERWWKISDELGVLRPTHAPRATEYVPDMVDFLRRLAEAGAAYEAADGLYFDTSSVPGYGLLARQSLDSLRAGARVATNVAKRAPFDFALWKAAKPGEPSWDSPWGPGRPGWHTECVVMSLDLLGEGFDLHGGGMDLAFPHHENERAQAAAAQVGFAGHWAHHAFVTAGGEKMSKSAHNFSTLASLTEAHDPRSYRLLVLRSHYRQPLEVTPETVSQAEEALSRLDAFARRFAPEGPLGIAVAPEEALLQAFVAAMEDDLDTPAALAALFEALRSANTLADGGDAQRAHALARAVLECFAVLGLEPAAGSDASPEVKELLRLRDMARRDRDFAAADHLRERISALGWVVEDTPLGSRLHR